MKKSRKRIQINKNYVGIFLILLIVEVLIALYVHDAIIRPFVGDILVVILVYSFIRIFWDNHSRLLPIYVFIFAVIIEFGQYFELVEKLKVENNPFIRVLIGTTFDIKDIVCYLLGTLILVALQTFKKKEKEKE